LEQHVEVMIDQDFIQGRAIKLLEHTMSGKLWFKNNTIYLIAITLSNANQLSYAL